MKDFDEFTGLDGEKYAGLINGAYPQPNGDLKDAVMARIAAEKSSRRRRTRSFVRWGSIAACLVIVAGAAIAVLPRLSTKTADFTSFDEAEQIVANDFSGEVNEAPADSNELPMFGGAAPLALAPDLASNGSKESYDRTNEYVPENDSDELYSNDIPTANGEPNSLILAEADFDIDGDGEIEHCTITPGPTSGLYSIWFTVYSPNGDEEFKDGFVLDWGSLEFETVDGKMMLKHCEHYHGIEILDGHVSLPTDCEDCMINGQKKWQE